MTQHRIGVIRGDGTGPEVVAEGLKVLEAVRDGFEVQLVEFDLGAERFLRTGEVLPDEELGGLRGCDAILLGAVGDPRVRPGILERDLLYTQQGFLVWRLDNRGSYGRGHAFETPIAGQLGLAALDDQLAGVDYLSTLPYADTTRIGTDGKSFGGYMTLYALIHAPDVFHCGVAGSGPTDWRYYDTIYTERYMKTPQQNPGGYAATNLVAKAGQIKVRPLLIHGLGDTNVHLQNTVNFIQALEAADKPFDFLPLPNLSHSYRGEGLVAALSASADYFARCLGGQ